MSFEPNFIDFGEDKDQDYSQFDLAGFTCATSDTDSKVVETNNCEDQPTEAMKKARAPRKARKGMQTSKACARCRSLKLKCDAQRPCFGCIKKGCAGSCVDWDAQVENCRTSSSSSTTTSSSDPDQALIERPIAWVVCNSSPATNQAPIGFEHLVGCSPREFMRLMFGKVFAPDRIQSWVTCFTDDQCEALVEFFKLSQMAFAGVRSTTDRMVLPSFDVKSEEATLLHEHPGVAYQCWKLAGNSCSVNDGYCRMMASHPEEVVARWRENDLSHVFTDLDALAQVLAYSSDHESAVSGEVRTVVSYCAVSRKWGKGPQRDTEAVLVQLTVLLHIDESGALACMERFFQPVSPEEFDAARASTPHLVRPFAAMICGDTRSGAELLQEYDFERRCTITELGAITCFRARIDAMIAFLRASSHALLAKLTGGNPEAMAQLLAKVRGPPPPTPTGEPAPPPTQGRVAEDVQGRPESAGAEQDLVGGEGTGRTGSASTEATVEHEEEEAVGRDGEPTPEHWSAGEWCGVEGGGGGGRWVGLEEVEEGVGQALTGEAVGDAHVLDGEEGEALGWGAGGRERELGRCTPEWPTTNAVQA